MRGSSPRVRGKRSSRTDRDRPRRLIPARAGKTPLRHHRPHQRWAHPRACGENNVRKALNVLAFGSSPRVRGKLPALGRVEAHRGLIPARAGKTSRRGASGRGTWAHPRACGENIAPGRVAARHSGSSPRVRGKRHVHKTCWQHVGLIPARAGKTARRSGSGRRRSAHPRACGENHGPACRSRANLGSSPRVRGKLSRCGPSWRARRLIPARAGKTISDGLTAQVAGAHPRACGENLSWPSVMRGMMGSSPRVRGKRVGVERSVHGDGLIPARAGKTPKARPASTQSRAHPRACGENLIDNANPLMKLGSSPRVRGKRHEGVGGVNDDGLIPARAGKTSSTTPTP